MRPVVIGFIGLLAIQGLRADPGAPPTADTTEFVRVQAAKYTSDLMVFFRWVETNYVRPVSRKDLALAALEGLYEAAKEPFPNSLRADVAHADDDDELRQIIRQARLRLGDREELRDSRALLASLRTVPRVLDPYSGLPQPGDRRSLSLAQVYGVGIDFESLPDALASWLDQQKDGFGSRFVPSRGPARVASVMPGSPAQQAGVRPGDILSAIEQHPVDSPEGLRLFARLMQVDTSEPRSITLTFVRLGLAAPVVVKLTPTYFVPESVFGVRRRVDHSWDFMLDRVHRIGYIRLGFIDESSSDEMTEAIGALKAEGMRGLIFDLRGNPGGFVEPAKAIAGLFIKSGLLAIFRDRRDGENRVHIDHGTHLLEGIPTVVLIDGETRGGGEMVAAVLQDHGVAVVAGSRTLGKGSIQRTDFVRLESGEQLDLQYKLTTGLFSRPNGQPIQRFPESRLSDDWGIRPDPGLEFPLSPEAARQVKDWMEQQVLRPGPSREVLPLDDPENDPLREFARQYLLRKLQARKSS
jgi:carboxyl-terminal processing protease